MDDIATDFSHQGLLETISAEDLEDTDLYIFRMSNDQLVMSREGLADNEMPYYAGGIDTSDDVIRFNLLMRGPASDRDYNVRLGLQAGRDIWLFENFQKAAGINPELQGGERQDSCHLSRDYAASLIRCS